MSTKTINLECLLEKIVALENRITALESNQTKQKTNAQTVPTLYTPTLKYMEWIKSLTVTQEHMETVFTQGYIQGMSFIICSLIEQTLGGSPIVLKPNNNNKKNHIYIYIEDKWSQMESKQLETLVDVVQSNLLKLFKQWKIDNPKYLTDQYSEILSKYHQNILGTKTPKITTIQRIQTNLCRSLL